MRFWFGYGAGMVVWAVGCGYALHYAGVHGADRYWLGGLLGLFYYVAVLSIRDRLKKARQERRVEPAQVETDDPVAAAIAAEAFRTGRTQHWTVDEDGRIHRHEDPPA